MSLFDALNTASSALSAQTVRLNLTASNLANAEAVAGTAEEAYQSRAPVFAQILDLQDPNGPTRGVKVVGIAESEVPAPRQYNPGHPLANEDGYVFASNVNAVEEMANMISASRSYQNNIEVMNTTKDMLMRTLSLGR